MPTRRGGEKGNEVSQVRRTTSKIIQARTLHNKNLNCSEIASVNMVKGRFKYVY